MLTKAKAAEGGSSGSDRSSRQSALDSRLKGAERLVTQLTVPVSSHHGTGRGSSLTSSKSRRSSLEERRNSTHSDVRAPQSDFAATDLNSKATWFGIQ